MGGTKCWRCGLRRLERDVRCYACGAPFGPAAAARARAGGGAPRILLGTSAVLAAKERVAPPGRLYNVARCLLGVPCVMVLAVWAWVGLFLTFTVFGPLLLIYAAPFMLYPLVSFYCCLRVLPARKVAALGLFAHLCWFLSAPLARYVFGERAFAAASSDFGLVLTLALLAAWVMLYAGRLIDEGRLRADLPTQTAVGVLIVVLTIAALALAHYSDQRAREREFERLLQHEYPTRH